MLTRLFLRDSFILLLILLNALIIFISGFDLGPKGNYIFTFLDHLVTILFIAEMIIKLRVYGKSYFSSTWNQFDFLLVMLSVPALLTFLLNLNIQDFSFLLVFRVLRVFKSFRFLKFIPGIDDLLRGIRRALKASIIVILGFMIYIFIIGIFSFYLFKESSPECFRNPVMALYSTFKIFTIEGWFEIPEKVAEGLSATSAFFVYIYFIFVVLSGGILGLSLVNSIFVEAMVSDNNDELERKLEGLEAKIDRLLDHQENKE